MKINIEELKNNVGHRHWSKRSRHNPKDRVVPSLWQYDYIVLSRLSQNIQDLLNEATREFNAVSKCALDIGCDKSPYRNALSALGWTVETLDIEAAEGVDYVGRVESTGLPDASFDLILCTEVMEHCESPLKALTEIHRILRPGGKLVWSSPFVWFYHPHPADNWRFTAEGGDRISNDCGFTVRQILSRGGSIAALFQICNFMLFGLIGVFGAPFYFINNIIGSALDRLVPNKLFSLGFAYLCEKPQKA